MGGINLQNYLLNCKLILVKIVRNSLLGALYWIRGILYFKTPLKLYESKLLNTIAKIPIKLLIRKNNFRGIFVSQRYQSEKII